MGRGGRDEDGPYGALHPGCKRMTRTLSVLRCTTMNRTQRGVMAGLLKISHTLHCDGSG
jgi:hypothetical protein